MRVVNYAVIGLQARDIRVYEALYGMRSASLRKLAQETGLNRGTVYETIKHLTERGLVSFTQSGERRHYIAADPEVLQALIRERREQLLALEVELEPEIQLLKAKRDGDLSTYFARFYEGDEGIASILRDVLQTLQARGEHEYCVFSAKDVSRFLYTNFKSFSRQRIKQKVFVRVLADNMADDKAQYAERRLLPNRPSESNGYVLLYGGKTALISLKPGNVLVGVVIEDEGITNMQRMIFESIWQQTA